MRKVIPLTLIFTLAITFTAWATEEITVTKSNEYAVFAEDNYNPRKNDFIAEKNNSDDDDEVPIYNNNDYFFYGRSSAILASGDYSSIVVGSFDISTSLYAGNGIFAQGGGITASNGVITTDEEYSRGLVVTGEGMITARSVDITTNKDLSPAILVDRGKGGSISVTNGTYKTEGEESPAILLNDSGSITARNIRAQTTRFNSPAIFSDRNGGTITIISGDYATVDEASPGIRLYGDAAITANDVNFKTAGKDSPGVLLSGDGKIELNNLDLLTTGESSPAILFEKGQGTITVNDGFYNTEKEYSPGISLSGTGEIIVNGGVYTMGDKNLPGKDSPGVLLSGDGKIELNNLDLLTRGDSSPAIISYKGKGTISVNGGYYETEGRDSPAIFSTSSIDISGASFDVNDPESLGVVVMGGGSVRLTNTNVSLDKSGSSEAVSIYQVDTWDSSDNRAVFSMTGGSITKEIGDIFTVANTSCDIILSGVTITHRETDQDEEIFLRVGAQENKTQNKNGGNATLTTNRQEIMGNIAVSGDSSLAISFRNQSTFIGAINPSAASNYRSVSNNTQESDSGSDSGEEEAELTAAATMTAGITTLYLEKDSKINLTGDSVITSWDIEDYNDIILENSATIRVIDENNRLFTQENIQERAAAQSNGNSQSNNDNPSAPPLNPNDGNNNGNGNGGGGSQTQPENPSANLLGPSGAGCQVSYAGVMALLACVALIMKKK